MTEQEAIEFIQVMSAEEWSAKKFALILEREQADLAARLVTHTHPLPGQAEDLARAEWWARDAKN